MRVRIITSCTGEKKVHPENQLILADFQAGTFFKPELESFELTAGEMYTGLQHQRLMGGVQQFREAGQEVELSIVSAGYGLIEEGQNIQPYEATFTGMPKKALKEWGARLGLPKTLKARLEEPADLQLVLLGDTYLVACCLDSTLDLKAPTFFLCGSAAQKKLPKVDNAAQVVLANKDAKRFSCGLVGLKGEVARRLLGHLRDHPDQLGKLVALPPNELLELLAGPVKPVLLKASRTPVVNEQVDRVITLSPEWQNSPHKAKINYFIPEWDDLVDPDFDFQTDTHSGGSGDWSNEVYAHQMYPSPNYDGILVSRAVAEKSKKKTERINSMGVHRFVRVPREFPIMGDCGAFDYIMEEVPPYSTEDVLDYYTRLDFDAGVSVDHLIVKATEHQRDFRYALTIDNAEAFLKEHRKRGLEWTPIGAVQGWNPEAYGNAARKLTDMGYGYLGLGGLVRATTLQILDIVRDVRSKIPADTKIHLFGIARPSALRRFVEAGVNSIDSASHLRRAWLGAGQNYFSLDGRVYTAIRIPEGGKSFRAKRMVSEGRATEAEVSRLERECLRAVRAFGRGEASKQETMDAILAYDELVDAERPDISKLLSKLLDDRPWESCPCDICCKDGIEVIIFRGNNRNRRRGFHNTFVFYDLLKRAVTGGKIPETWEDHVAEQVQLEMEFA
jgi:hypothetical protein